MTANEIILLIIAIAFVIFVIFAAIVLIKLAKVLFSLQKQIDIIGAETKDLVHSAGQISDDFLYKMKNTNPLFQALSNVGEGLETKSYHFKERAYWQSRQKHCKTQSEAEDLVTDFVNLALAGVQVWLSVKHKNEG